MNGSKSNYGGVLSTRVAGVKLNTCVYNASGPRTGTAPALKKIAESESGAVLSKSATLVPQPKGNPLPRTWQGDTASLNSEGLPNYGVEYYAGKECVEAAKGKPFFVSLSGKTTRDNLEMIRKVAKVPEVSLIELNLACPNVIGHPILGYDFEDMQACLDAVHKEESSRKKPLGVKLPPYFDNSHFEKAANIINGFKGTIKFVTSINTVGNCLVVDADVEQPELRPTFGGMSGPAVKHIALSNVCKLRRLLDPSIDVVGVGGIRSGRDAFEMILCGASAIQIGTCHWMEGGKAFARINRELAEIMTTKGYTCIEDFRGKLKPWSKERAKISNKLKREKKKSGQNGTLRSGSSTSPRSLRLLVAFLLVVIAVLLAIVFNGTVITYGRLRVAML